MYLMVRVSKINQMMNPGILTLSKVKAFYLIGLENTFSVNC